MRHQSATGRSTDSRFVDPASLALSFEFILDVFAVDRLPVYHSCRYGVCVSSCPQVDVGAFLSFFFALRRSSIPKIRRSFTYDAQISSMAACQIGEGATAR